MSRQFVAHSGSSLACIPLLRLPAPSWRITPEDQWARRTTDGYRFRRDKIRQGFPAPPKVAWRRGTPHRRNSAAGWTMLRSSSPWSGGGEKLPTLARASAHVGDGFNRTWREQTRQAQRKQIYRGFRQNPDARLSLADQAHHPGPLLQSCSLQTRRNHGQNGGYTSAGRARHYGATGCGTGRRALAASQTRKVPGLERTLRWGFRRRYWNAGG